MTKFRLIVFLLAVQGMDLFACRFTVRDIGFSILSQDLYTLAVIDGHANPEDVFWDSYHRQNKDCNIRLEILNPEKDDEHPIVISAKEQGLSFPATLFVAPDRRIFVFQESDFESIYSKAKDSFLREKMRTEYPDVFAQVFWVKGKHAEQNRRFSSKVLEECRAIENIMPSMPKMVKQGPVAFGAGEEDFEKEKVLLWSLGIESMADEPLAFVLYGRGRIMGEALSYEQVMDGALYRYMSMIGADCECGLDRKWMLGHQIPLYWSADTRQHLANLVGFDVDNPMILAEMSRILAKEKLSDASGSVAFAPESIDLEEVFGNSSSKERMEVQLQTPVSKENKAGMVLLFSLLGMVVLVLAGAAVVLYKKR